MFVGMSVRLPQYINGTKIVVIAQHIILKGRPAFMKSINLYPPMLWTIRFVWYPMGVEKLAEAAIHTVIKKGIGSIPKLLAMARATGNANAAAALLVMNSVTIAVTKYNAAIIPTGPKLSEILIREFAIESAIPEFCIAADTANAEAIAIRTSQLMNLVYFLAGNSLNSVIANRANAEK